MYNNSLGEMQLCGLRIVLYHQHIQTETQASPITQGLCFETIKREKTVTTTKCLRAQDRHLDQSPGAHSQRLLNIPEHTLLH